MKIGFLIVNRANWARSKTIAMALVDMGVEVKIYSASSMNLEKFGTPVLDIEAEQAYEVTRIMSNVEGKHPRDASAQHRYFGSIINIEFVIR